MDNEVYKEVYGHILNDSQRIRKEIMNEWGDTLMFGGSMSQEAIDELATAARITGLSFDALAKHGVEITAVSGKPDLFGLTVRDESYVCHKSAIPSMVGFLDEVNIPGVSVEKPAPVEKKEKPVAKAPEKEKAVATPEPESVPDEMDNMQPTEEVDEYPVSEDVAESVENDSAGAFEKEEPVVDEASPEELPEDTEAEEDIEVKPLGAEIIGGTPNIGILNRSDIFIEEKRKKFSEFVYEMFNVSLTHSGMSGGGRPTEIQVMVAPLKIQKFACPTVPILVSVYCDGKIQHSSSYEQKEDGKNLVQMNVNEFYLLFRGTFDANGEFHAYITTTGISANQGDIMNVTSNEKFGKNAGRGVNNGHVKFRSTIYGEPGTIEVLPFGDIDSDEFVVMTKTDEFVDYIYIANTQGGMKKATIFTDDDKKSQIECFWDDEDCLNVELKEV